MAESPDNLEKLLESRIAKSREKLKKAKDGFGFETNDGSLSAHFEQTVAVTEKGGQVLTKL